MTEPARKVLITGAAGFVGSCTVDLLLEHGYQVTALDALDPQVHGADAHVPVHLAPHLAAGRIEFVRGDVRDRALMQELLGEAEAVIHLAAAVGVAQSMYSPQYYCDVNVGGTATLIDVLANHPHRVGKIVVASSMSIYGEGAYLCPSCGPIVLSERDSQRLVARQWEPDCPTCETSVSAVPTPESKPLSCTSVYAVTKRMQEEMTLLFGKAYRIPVIALRYFNIYGPRQSLNNPYTGVAAIFLARLLNHNPPLVYEDGRQSRDFIHVRDVARANLLALEAPTAVQRVYNVGTGQSTTVLDIARTLADSLAVDMRPTITNRFRAGDVRHCIADCSRIAAELGFRAQISRADGFRELVEWSRNQKPTDLVAVATRELEKRSLVG